MRSGGAASNDYRVEIFKAVQVSLVWHMMSDCRFERFLTYRRALNKKLIIQHHRRSNRQSGCLVFGCPVCLSCFGDGFNLQIVFLSQPEEVGVKAVSGLPSRVIDKDAEFDHYLSLKKLRLAEKTIHQAFFLWLGQSKFSADAHFQIVICKIGTFHDDIVTDHNRWSYWQIKSEVLVGLVLRFRLCGDIDFNRIFFAQPGHNLLEMFSRFAVWLIQKKTHFEHDFLLL